MPPSSREPDRAAPELASSPQAPQKQAPSLVISATFTAEPIEPVLSFWLRELGLDYQIRFAPYNQVFQQLLDPSSLLVRNRSGMNAVLVRLEDWSRFRQSSGIRDLEENVERLAQALRSVAESGSSPILVCVCPASPGFLAASERSAFTEKSQDFLRSALGGLPAVNLVTASELSGLYPVGDYYDPHADELGHVPYTAEFFAALGTMIARRLHASRMLPYKVIALDCDDTLWQGVCGEDGPKGVQLNNGHRTLHEFMLRQRESGMLLCLASKNNPEDVEETFRAHPEMPLALHHFNATRLNWEPKSANLRSLAGELNLDPASFIFLDNSAAECAEVESNCPEVLALRLPADADEFARFLNHVWAFDRWRTTAEDRARSAYYAQEAERARLERQSSNFEEFIASLNLEVRMASAEPGQLARVSQLTQRTSQMNFTTIRRSEAEIRSLLRSGAFECLAVDVTDRFGSYGLSGVMLFQAGSHALHVDTFLLSCRALGRGVEHRMLARLGEIAAERGLREVEIPFAPTPRNRPAEALLAGIGARFQQKTPDGSIFRFPAEELVHVRYRSPGRLPVSTEKRPAAPGASQAGLKRVNFGRIARNLREPEQILAAVRASSGRRDVAPAATGAPRTELEQQLSAMWASLLGIPSVGIQDNFFDLGGHSLLAVELLSQVRQKFGVDLSLKVVYSGDFTVAELAKSIELREIQNAGAGRYAAILEELERLTDEEARALLAKERTDGGGSDPRA